MTNTLVQQKNDTRSDDPPTFALPEIQHQSLFATKGIEDWYLSYIYDINIIRPQIRDNWADYLWDWDNDEDRDNFNPLWGAQRVSRWRPHRDERRKTHRYKKNTRRSKNTGKRQSTKLV